MSTIFKTANIETATSFTTYTAAPVPNTLVGCTYVWSVTGGAINLSGNSASFAPKWNQVGTHIMYCVITCPSSGGCPATPPITQQITVTVSAGGGGQVCTGITGCTITP
jgi:hypothetical protein